MTTNKHIEDEVCLCKKNQHHTLFLVGFIAGLITFIVYMPALNNDFVNWDDNVYVYENINIQSFDLRFFKWSLTSRVMDLWHPLSFISFAFDYAAWGLDPKGYHLANVLFHVLNTILVYIISVRLILICNPKFNEKAIISGFMTALLFGIHPLHVESVAWVSERKDVLCAFFYLFSLLAYLRYLSPGAKRYDYALSLIFYILALISKPMALSLPMVLLILDYYPLMRLKMIGNSKKVFIEKLPFFILGALSVLITLWPVFSETSAKVAPHPITERMMVFISGYVFYLQKILFPTHLAPLYPYPLKVSLLSYYYLGSMAVFLLISAFCIYAFKRGKLFVCLWLYYIVSLLPVMGVIGTGTPHSMADRYTYLPSIGPFMLIGFAVGDIYERYSKRTLLVTTFILFFLSGVLIEMTVKQIRVWHDPMTMWTHEIRLFPNVSIVHSHLGQAYSDLGNNALALREFNKAIELNMASAELYNFRGAVNYLLGNYQQAIRDYNIALEINSNSNSNSGTGFNALTKNGKALMKDVIASDEVLYCNRGNAYYGLGDYDKAINDYTKAIEINPLYVDGYNSRGYIYYEKGNYSQALIDLKKAVDLDHRHSEAYFNLGLVHSRLGDIKQALIYHKMAADLGLKKAKDELSRLQSKEGK